MSAIVPLSGVKLVDWRWGWCLFGGSKEALTVTSAFSLSLLALTDSHHSSGALCLRETHPNGWDMQGRVYTKWSLN